MKCFCSFQVPKQTICEKEKRKPPATPTSNQENKLTYHTGAEMSRIRGNHIENFNFVFEKTSPAYWAL